MSASTAVVLKAEVVDAEPSLEALAVIINAEHVAVESAFGEMIDRVIACGNAILEAKATARLGEWRGWAEEHLDMGKETIDLYCRIAKHAEFIRASGCGSISQAKSLLTDANLPILRVAGRTDPAHISAVRKLRDDGMTYRAICAETGYGMSYVQRLISPNGLQKQREAQARYNAKNRDRRAKERAEARRLEQERAHAATVKRIAKKGGQVAVAYGHVRKAQEALANASADEGDTEARRAITAAQAALTNAEDHIVRASKVGNS